jgi:hypothetical protein
MRYYTLNENHSETVFGICGGAILFIMIGKCMKFLTPRKRTAMAMSEQLQKDERRRERYSRAMKQKASRSSSDRPAPQAERGTEGRDRSGGTRAEATLFRDDR